MNDEVSTADRHGEMRPAIGLLQVIIGLLVVIAIVLLIILARGPQDQDRSGASVPVAFTTITA